MADHRKGPPRQHQARDAEILRRWNNHETAGAIGKAMGGLSKAIVTGVVRRAGDAAEARASPILPPRGRPALTIKRATGSTLPPLPSDGI